MKQIYPDLWQSATGFSENTCLLGTLVQEMRDTHPVIRKACAHHIDPYIADIEADVAAALRSRGIHTRWTADSLARTSRPSSSAFVLANASQDARVAVECLEHSQRYLETIVPRSHEKGGIRMATAARSPQISQDEAAINAVVAAIDAAHLKKDAAAVTAHYRPGAMLFDLAPPLGHPFDSRGLAAWFETWKGPVRREHRDVEIEVSGDLAVRRALVRVSATTRTGEEAAWWMRSTICFRREDGTWKVVHEHESVPFHMDGSFRAAVDLEP